MRAIIALLKAQRARLNGLVFHSPGLKEMPPGADLELESSTTG
jgi:hypothetical protein